MRGMATVPVARTQVVPLMAHGGAAQADAGLSLGWEPALVPITLRTLMMAVAAAPLPLAPGRWLQATEGAPVKPVPLLVNVTAVTGPEAGTHGPFDSPFTTDRMVGVPSGYSASGRL